MTRPLPHCRSPFNGQNNDGGAAPEDAFPPTPVRSPAQHESLHLRPPALLLTTQTHHRYGHSWQSEGEENVLKSVITNP